MSHLTESVISKMLFLASFLASNEETESNINEAVDTKRLHRNVKQT